MGHDHGGDDDLDVDVVPNKLDHVDVEDDGRDGVHAHDVGDGHDGHDDRPWSKVLKNTAKHVFSTTWVCNSYCLEHIQLCEDTEEQEEEEARSTPRQRRPTRKRATRKT